MKWLANLLRGLGVCVRMGEAQADAWEDFVERRGLAGCPYDDLHGLREALPMDTLTREGVPTAKELDAQYERGDV